MLEQRDLDMIRGIIQEESKGTEKRLGDKIKESENMLMDELGRTYVDLDRKIEAVQKNIEELNSYYRITRLESDNTSMLLKMIESQAQIINDLSKRVSELEMKTA